LINEAVHAGARLRSACAELCLSLRTYHRWQDGGGIKTDGRPHAVRPVPAHKLSDEERERILQTCHQPEYASLPPTRIARRRQSMQSLLVPLAQQFRSSMTIRKVHRQICQ